ncbi:MAG: DUF882 domain-containing protein [Rhizobiales bacterium]|nr:DUF882 domain-containing protein [Hyphomicrobiales bacterium]
MQRNGSWFRRCRAGLKVAVASALLAGTVLLSTAVDNAEAAAGDRAITLLNVHTNEQATVVFKRGNRYDQAGLKKLNYLLRDWRKNQPTNMDPHLFDLIWEVYRQSGSRQPIHVVCGFRSPTTNEMLRTRSRYTGVAKHSQHMLGKAMDFYIPDVALPKLRAIGLRMQVGGVGFYPTSGSPFVHMDTGSVRHWPKMTREQLVRVFPDGKTLHIPSDGRPLPGYEQALAEYKARKASGGEIMMASGEAPKSKSWFGKMFGGGADEAEDTADTGAPDGKSAETAVAAADAEDTAAPTPAKKPVEVAQAAEADVAAPEAETVVADIPLPRPSPVARDAAGADVMQVADAAVPPIPRASPVARPMVAMASATGNAAPRTAADAIADAVGSRNDNAAPVMAYAPVDAGSPHIDASSGALVAGRAASLRGSAKSSGKADAHLVPVGYSVATLQLVMRSGSMRQMDYAELAMPHPFSVPEFFAAAEMTKSSFGRVAYNTKLRADRSASLVTRDSTNMKVASN